MANNIPFKTAYKTQERQYSPTGDGTTPEYGYELDSYGRKKLVETGRKNTYEEIQSYAEECKIENILAKAAIGDMSDFRPDGIYQDVTAIPNNMIEAQKQIMNLQKTWNGLPTDMKAKYNWSVDEFIAQSGEEAWLVDMGMAADKVILEKNPKIEPPKIEVETPKETK